MKHFDDLAAFAAIVRARSFMRAAARLVLGELRGKPAGTDRITATDHAARTLIRPRLEPWLRK
jgi:hypothetical protein